MSTDELIEAIIQWGKDRKIDSLVWQSSKVTEEWGETVGELNHRRFGADFKDGIGDTLVSLIIFAGLAGTDIRECLVQAYNEIKDRTGETIDGTFVKNS